MKINSCVAIHFRCRGKVELINRYLTAMLVPDEERGRRENVVMNLLRWAAIFEDQRDRLLVARDLRRMRRLICGLIGAKRRRGGSLGSRPYPSGAGAGESDESSYPMSFGYPAK